MLNGEILTHGVVRGRGRWAPTPPAPYSWGNSLSQESFLKAYRNLPPAHSVLGSNETTRIGISFPFRKQL